MKLARILSGRSRTNSPAPSAPSSPASSSSSCSTSPTVLTESKKLRFFKPHLGRSHSKRRTADRPDGAAGSHDIAVEVPTLTAPLETPKHHDQPASAVPLGKAGKLVDGESSSAAAAAAARQLGKVPERGMEEIEQVFAQFDANGDGKISSEELQAVLASLGDETTREEAMMMVREVDMDGDGFINLEEFVEMNRRCLKQAAAVEEEKEIKEAFAVFDLDKNGRITAEKLQLVLRRLGGSLGQRSSVEECRRMIRGVDRKGVGHVDFDDFKRMMTPLSF